MVILVVQFIEVGVVAGVPIVTSSREPAAMESVFALKFAVLEAFASVVEATPVPN